MNTYGGGRRGRGGLRIRAGPVEQQWGVCAQSADGNIGNTTKNLALFCTSHHTMLHTGRWTLHGNAHDLTIHCPDNTTLNAPPPAALDTLETRQLALV